MQGIQILLRGARKTVPSYYLSTLWKPRRRDPAQLRRKHVKRVSETWCTALYSPILLLSGTETSAMDAGLRIRRGFESSPVNSPHVFLRFVWEGKRSLARRSNPHAIARARARVAKRAGKRISGVRTGSGHSGPSTQQSDAKRERQLLLFGFRGGAPPVT